MEEKRVYFLGQPPMTEKEWKIYNKRQSLIKAGKLDELKKYDELLAAKENKIIKEES